MKIDETQRTFVPGDRIWIPANTSADHIHSAFIGRTGTVLEMREMRKWGSSDHWDEAEWESYFAEHIDEGHYAVAFDGDPIPGWKNEDNKYWVAEAAMQHLPPPMSTLDDVEAFLADTP